MGREHGVGLLGERGILDPGVRERLGDAPVEHRVGRLVDDRAGVAALEVDRVDRAGALEQSAIRRSSQELVGSSLKRSPG